MATSDTAEASTSKELEAAKNMLAARDNELLMVMKQLEKFSFMADQQTGKQRTLMSISPSGEY